MRISGQKRHSNKQETPPTHKMSIPQLATLITDMEERLTQMKSLVVQLQEKAAKKASKKAAKPLVNPDIITLSDSDVPSTPVSKKTKRAPDAPKKSSALPLLPKSPAPAPAAEPEPEPAPKKERAVSAWATALKEVYVPLVKEALGEGVKMNGIHMKVAGYLKKNGNEKPTLNDVKAAIEFLQSNPDYKSDTAMRRASDSSSETSAKKRGRPKKVVPVPDSGSVSVSDEERWARNCRPLTDQHGRPLPK